MNVFEYSLAGVFLDAGGMVYNVRHPSFGADGGGEVDDTDAILAALRAAPDGATVVVPHGRYRVSATVTVDRRVRLTGGGTLVAADGADLDQVLLVAADHAQVDNLRVDQGSVTANAGRGEGVRVGGTSTRIQNVHVLGEGAAGGSLSNGFLVGGARNLLIGCSVENAGYAGFRNDGDFNRYYAVQARAVGRGDSVRGFIHNGDARHLVLDGAHFHTDSSHAASVGILIDAGAGRELSHLVLRGTYSGTTGEETLKLAGVARADVSESRFEGGPIQLAEGLGRVVLRDCTVDRGRLAFGASVIPELVLDRVDVTTGARYALGDLVVSRLVMRDCEVRGFGSLALRNARPWGEVERVVVEGCRFRGRSASEVRVWGETGRGTLDASGKLVFMGNHIENDGPGGAAVHADDEAGRLFATLDHSARTYRAGSPPTGGRIRWRVGDRAYAEEVEAGGPVGWVCVEAGAPGVWKAFGSVSS